MATSRGTDRGGALLAVLWLSAALSVIAFSLANTVRGEIERASTAVDGLRSQYLAAGAVRRAVLYLNWGRSHPDLPQYRPSVPYYIFEFPTGEAKVEIISEAGKLNINTGKPEDLMALLLNLGVDSGRANQIVAAIVDWRTAAEPVTGPQGAPAKAFQDIEELLSVSGMTPDIFYGGWDRAPDGSAQRLVPRAALRDCVSVFGGVNRFDVNSAPQAVLAMAGVPPAGIAAIIARRNVQAFQPGDLGLLEGMAGGGYQRLRIGGNTMFTLRATARLRLPNGQLSDMRRSMAALVRLMERGWVPPCHILRWYDYATAPE
jgi:general secretion pathway protein K